MSARDPNSALETALRTYYDYCACVRAASPALKPTLLNLEAAVVQLPNEPPLLRRLPIHARRFRMRGGADRELFGRLDALVGASPVAATFVRNFAEATERLREGDVDSALEALILNQDLAFQGCRAHDWRYPRYLVELGSKLVALDWPRRYFTYIETYCRQTSHAVDPLPGIKDRKRACVLLLARNAWPLITNDQRWEQLMARTPWDSLLEYRRKHFMHSLAHLSETVTRVRTLAAWDLARAVRARNTLVHEGSYLRHHQLIGVLLDVYELILRLRLAGFDRRPTNPDAGFVNLANELEKDFDDLQRGAFRRQTLRSLCEDGWGALWIATAPAAPAPGETKA